MVSFHNAGHLQKYLISTFCVIFMRESTSVRVHDMYTKVFSILLWDVRGCAICGSQCGQRSWLPGLTWRSWTSCRGLRIYFMIDFNMVDPNPSLMSHMKLCFNSPFLFPFECPRGGCWLHDGGAAVAETGGSCMHAVHRTVSFISANLIRSLPSAFCLRNFDIFISGWTRMEW